MIRQGVLGLVTVLASVVSPRAAGYSEAITAALEERASFSRDTGGQPSVRRDHIRGLDLDGDGRDDFILDDNRYDCSTGSNGLRNSAGCAIQVFLGGANGSWKRVVLQWGARYAIGRSGRSRTLTIRDRAGTFAYRFPSWLRHFAPGQRA